LKHFQNIRLVINAKNVLQGGRHVRTFEGS